jgi:hypothetical protein
MQAPNERTPITGHIGTIFVAIELSQKSWRWATRPHRSVE